MLMIVSSSVSLRTNVTLWRHVIGSCGGEYEKYPVFLLCISSADDMLLSVYPTRVHHPELAHALTLSACHVQYLLTALGYMFACCHLH